MEEKQKGYGKIQVCLGGKRGELGEVQLFNYLFLF